MNEIGKAIYQEIINDPDLSLLLENDEGNYNIFPTKIPDGVLPDLALVYSDGLTSNTYPNAETSIYDFLCVADTYADSRELADKLKELFNDKRNNNLGGLKTVTYTKFETSNSFYDDEGDKYITAVEIFIKY